MRHQLAPALERCLEARTGATSVDLALVFARSRAELRREVERVERTLGPDGACWACWPKPSSGVVTDLSDNVVREVGLATGLVDVKVAAISTTWSGLKFVRRRVDRNPPSRS